MTRDPMCTDASRIRMLLHWQNAAGLPFVASVHHRAVQCFKYHGNVKHENNDATVGLASFQEAIKIRHRLGNDGIQAAEEMGRSLDFDKLGA